LWGWSFFRLSRLRVKKTSKPLVDNVLLENDSSLVAEFGADQHGMKSYVLAFLKEGPNKAVDAMRAEELFQGRMKKIDRMAKNGDLVLVAPFLDRGG
jgi:hypothetical protein